MLGQSFTLNYMERQILAIHPLHIIDELNALAPRRENGRSDQERKVVASLVMLLDRLHSMSSVVVTASSRLERVDPSIRRPGRLDMEV